MKSTCWVESLTPAFFERLFVHLEPALQRFREAHAQREVAGSVLIVQRVVVQDARFGDGGGVWHKRTLAEALRAFVRAEDFLEQVFAFFRFAADRFPFVEGDREVLNQVAAVI